MMGHLSFILFLSLITISLTFNLNINENDEYNVGIASRSILPLVNGSLDYLTYFPPEDHTTAGVFIEKFDVGEIAVGNGAESCHWVRNDIRVRAMTIGPDPQNKTVLFLVGEVYMLFKNDLKEFHEMLKEKIGDDEYNNLYIMVGAQHNHEGPDTSGLNIRTINHEYYKYMLELMVDAAVEALDNMEPAELYYGENQFYYGLGDNRDPLIMDATVRVLRAYRKGLNEDHPFATFVQWGMHPEITLGYRPTFDENDCAELPVTSPCSARNAYFTADYPGYLSDHLSLLQGGGEVIYFNGAIGVQIGNNKSPIWDPKDFPVGNGLTYPEGAEPIPENFYRTYLIGTQLAYFIHNSIENINSEPLAYGEFEYREINLGARITNFLFKVGLVPRNALNPFASKDRPLRIGNTLREAYLCNGNNPDFSECISDNFAYNYDNITKLPYRVGNWMETSVSFLRLANIRFLTLPGEVCPELITGLPTDFDDDSSVDKYYRQPEEHAVGKDYTMPGAVMSMMGNCNKDNPCFILGLTQDEIGYIFPLSDWKIKCVQDAETCLDLYLMGASEYSDSVTGDECKRVLEFPTLTKLDYDNKFGPGIFSNINATCYYGQAYGQVNGHYEETNSGSLFAAEALLNAIGELLAVPVAGRYCTTNCAGVEPDYSTALYP